VLGLDSALGFSGGLLTPNRILSVNPIYQTSEQLLQQNRHRAAAANVRFPSHRWKIGKPGGGDPQGHRGVHQGRCAGAEPDEPVPANPVL